MKKDCVTNCSSAQLAKGKEPRGIRNNNPLNIRKGSNWKGERPNQTDPAFEEFVSMEYGIRAALRLMRNHITGFKGSRPAMNTLKKLISVWAPPSENATTKYVDFVSANVGLSSSQIIDPDDAALMCKIARAMAFVECGVWIDKEKFKSAWNLM